MVMVDPDDDELAAARRVERGAAGEVVDVDTAAEIVRAGAANQAGGSDAIAEPVGVGEGSTGEPVGGEQQAGEPAGGVDERATAEPDGRAGAGSTGEALGEGREGATGEPVGIGVGATGEHGGFGVGATGEHVGFGVGATGERVGGGRLTGVRVSRAGLTAEPVDIALATEPVDITAEAVAAAEHERRRAQLRRVRNIMLIVLAVVVVVAGIFVGPTAWQVFQQRNTKVSAPDAVAGLQRNTGDSATETAEYIRDAIDTAVNLGDSVGAVYWDGTNQDRSILFAGGEVRLWAPASGLDDAFKVITDDTGGVRDVRTVPAGPLGGVMHCGTTTTDEGDISVCGWADHGSLAVALFPNRRIDESAKLMLDLRSAMERR